MALFGENFFQVLCRQFNLDEGGIDALRDGDGGVESLEGDGVGDGEVAGNDDGRVWRNNEPWLFYCSNKRPRAIDASEG